MAHVYFDLPDGLTAKAKEAGIPMAQVVEEAVRAAVAPLSPTPEVSEVDDTDRYRAGRTIGDRWVSTVATVEELIEIAALGSTRWSDYGLDVNHHSLGSLLLEEGEVEPTSDGRSWLTRGPFVEGLIASAVQAAPAR